VPDATIHENGPNRASTCVSRDVEVWLKSLPKNRGQQVYLQRICYSSGSMSSYSGLSLSRVGDLSLSESADPSVKHVGQLEERKLLRRSSSRSEFGPSLCKGYSLPSPTYTQLHGMTASVNPATATLGLITKEVSPALLADIRRLRTLPTNPSATPTVSLRHST
jgi:hypothetical protein